MLPHSSSIVGMKKREEAAPKLRRTSKIRTNLKPIKKSTTGGRVNSIIIQDVLSLKFKVSGRVKETAVASVKACSCTSAETNKLDRLGVCSSRETPLPTSTKLRT